MAKRKKQPKIGGPAEIVRGEMITLKPIDWSDTIDDIENWTCGPLQPVGAQNPAPQEKQPPASRRKKNTRRKKP